MIRLKISKGKTAGIYLLEVHFEIISFSLEVLLVVNKTESVLEL